MLNKFLTQTCNVPVSLQLPFPATFSAPTSHLEVEVMTKQIHNMQKDWLMRSCRSLSASGKQSSPAMQRWKISILRYEEVWWAGTDLLFDIIWGHPHFDKYTFTPFHTQSFASRTRSLSLSLTQLLASLTIHNQEKRKQIRKKNHTLW